MGIRRILIPLDFSDDSLNALKYACELARPLGAELLILYVLEPIYFATPADVYATNTNLAMLMDEQRGVGSQQLARISAELTKKGQRARTVLKTGSPAHVIVDTAKTARADLIVMATHGRTGLAHLVMGSVAEKVVRTAACPVLTVRPAAKRTRSRQKTGRPVGGESRLVRSSR